MRMNLSESFTRYALRTCLHMVPALLNILDRYELTVEENMTLGNGIQFLRSLYSIFQLNADVEVSSNLENLDPLLSPDVIIDTSTLLGSTSITQVYEEFARDLSNDFNQE